MIPLLSRFRLNTAHKRPPMFTTSTNLRFVYQRLTVYILIPEALVPVTYMTQTGNAKALWYPVECSM